MTPEITWTNIPIVSKTFPVITPNSKCKILNKAPIIVYNEPIIKIAIMYLFFISFLS